MEDNAGHYCDQYGADPQRQPGAVGEGAWASQTNIVHAIDLIVRAVDFTNYASSMNSTDSRQQNARRSPRRVDLGIVDALVQTSFLIQQMLGEITGEHDLSIIQAQLLGVLRDRELRMSQLAQLLGLSKQSATGLVDRAERRGLLRRVSIPVGDERAVHVSLTDEGRRLAEEIRDQVARRVTVIAADLPETNRMRLSKLLSQLVGVAYDQHGADIDQQHSRATR